MIHRTRVGMEALASACEFYIEEYGSMDRTEQDAVYEALAGDNLREIRFCARIDGRDFRVDEWGTVIRLTLNTRGHLRLVSCGPDQVFDDGKNDDLVLERTLVSQPADGRTGL